MTNSKAQVYFDGPICKRGHTTLGRYVKGGGCVECSRERSVTEKRDPDKAARKKERAKARRERKARESLSQEERAIAGTRNSWSAARARCNNPNNPNFDRYGGRGITFDSSWDSFDAFLADMGVRPEGGTLERVDNDGPYSPENCVWASRSEQSQNRQTTLKLTYGGETLTLVEWSNKTGISYTTLKARLRRLGYTPEQCIEKPVKCGEPLPGKKLSRRVLTNE